MRLKKIFSKVLAVAAALTMTVSVMAAGSIVGSIDMPNASASEGTVSLDQVQPGTFDSVIQAVVDQLNQASAQSTLKDAFGSFLTNVNLFGAQGLEMENMDLSAFKFLSQVMSLSFSGATASAASPVRISFVANNLTDNVEVYVLYYCAEHGWELLRASRTSSNEIAADFHSLTASAPVALVYKEKASGSSGVTDATSPKTGEKAGVPFEAVAVLLLGLGGYAIRKSRREA